MCPSSRRAGAALEPLPIAPNSAAPAASLSGDLDVETEIVSGTRIDDEVKAGLPPGITPDILIDLALSEVLTVLKATSTESGIAQRPTRSTEAA